MKCPYCDELSRKVHSIYEREIQDLPLQNKKTILLVRTRKFLCLNPECRKNLSIGKATSVRCFIKTPSIVDNLSVQKVCMNNFAIRKKFSYGTVIVELETHR